MRIGEDELIDRIRRRIPASPGGAMRLGIGDDAAVIRSRPGTEWVFSCDQFVENIHFLTAAQPPEAIGYKALARAVSDLGAMGARPRFFLLSLWLPSGRTGTWLDRMTRGMGRAARQFGLTLAGGDTARSLSSNPAVALNLMVIGEIAAGHAVGRGGARPGDALPLAARTPQRVAIGARTDFAGHRARAAAGAACLLRTSIQSWPLSWAAGWRKDGWLPP